MNNLMRISGILIVALGVMTTKPSLANCYFGGCRSTTVAVAVVSTPQYGQFNQGFNGWGGGWGMGGTCGMGTHSACGGMGMGMGMGMMNPYRPMNMCPQRYHGKGCYLRGWSCVCRRKGHFGMHLGIGNFFNLNISTWG